MASLPRVPSVLCPADCRLFAHYDSFWLVVEGGLSSSPDSMTRLSCLQNGSVRVSGENKLPMVTDSTRNTFYMSKKARFECNIMVIILSATVFVNEKKPFSLNYVIYCNHASASDHLCLFDLRYFIFIDDGDSYFQA